MSPKKHDPKPPGHLAAPTRRWWASVVASYELEEHHLRLLTLAGESWDRCTQAREAIREHGLTYDDRFGCPRSRPEVAVERDSRVAFARLIRELALDVEAPPELPRPAGIRGNADLQSEEE
jgi:phage terminase small subunit